jgi:hypothetical protein
MSKQIRHKESVVQITKSGVRLGGTMLKITDFRLQPEVEILRTRFVGEKRDSPDLDVMGYSGSFNTQKRDRVWFDLWNEIQAAEEAGTELPEISMAVTDSYRDGTRLTVVLHGELVLKLDTSEIPNGGYQTAAWSFFCQFASGV